MHIYISWILVALAITALVYSLWGWIQCYQRYEQKKEDQRWGRASINLLLQAVWSNTSSHQVTPSGWWETYNTDKVDSKRLIEYLLASKLTNDWPLEEKNFIGQAITQFCNRGNAVNHCKRRASDLKRFVDGQEIFQSYHDMADQIDKERLANALSWSDLSTSEEEWGQLLRACARRAASCHWLALRGNSDNIRSLKQQFRREMDLAEISLDDLALSPEEVARVLTIKPDEQTG